MTATTTLTPESFDALRAAVTLAKNRGIKTVAELRRQLLGAGFNADVSDSAIEYWSNHVRSTGLSE